MRAVPIVALILIVLAACGVLAWLSLSGGEDVVGRPASAAQQTDPLTAEPGAAVDDAVPLPAPDAPTMPDPTPNAAEDSTGDAASTATEPAATSRRDASRPEKTDAEKGDLDEQLRTTVTCKFSDAPLQEVVDYLAHTTKTNIVIDPELAASDLSNVTLDMQEVELGSLLDVLGMLGGFKVKQEGTVVMLTRE